MSNREITPQEQLDNILDQLNRKFAPLHNSLGSVAKNFNRQKNSMDN